MRRLLGLVVLSCCVGVAPAAAAPFLDIDVDQNAGSLTGLGGIIVPTQTFTVETSGTITQVEVELFGGPAISLTLDLYAYPLSTGQVSLGTSSVVSPSYPTSLPGAWVAFPFNLPVNAGDLLAIEISGTFAPFTPALNWVSGPDVYAGGAGGTSLFGTSFTPSSPAADLSFRIWVDAGSTTVVPEPASLYLITSGVIAWVARRRSTPARRTAGNQTARRR